MPTSTTSTAIRPFRVRGREVSTINDLASVIVVESDEYRKRVPLATDEQRADFLVSSDALNFWRMRHRIMEEHGAEEFTALRENLKSAICDIRGYEADEFEFALVATENRARSAFGLTPLVRAHMRAARSSFRLTVPELEGSPIATEIASLAFALQRDVGDTNILLPIEQLRIILGRRKVVISGGVRRLVDVGVLRMVEEKYHTRRAREYRFEGVSGVHFTVSESESE